MNSRPFVFLGALSIILVAFWLSPSIKDTEPVMQNACHQELPLEFALNGAPTVASSNEETTLVQSTTGPGSSEMPVSLTSDSLQNTDLDGPIFPAEAAPPEVQTTANALRLFHDFCVDCHGADGRGDDMRAGMPAIPDFTLPAWRASREPSQLVTSILIGRGQDMPAFADQLTPDQAHDLAAFIRTLAGPDVDAVTEGASDFKEQFQRLQLKWNDLERQLQELE
jgi:mono/diheme cytochrome c family protein